MTPARRRPTMRRPCLLRVIREGLRLMSDWKIFQGRPDEQHDGISRLPDPPPWRDFSTRDEQVARTFRPSAEEIGLVNAALYLRRPLLVTGLPGTGKSSLAYAVARELKLGKVLRWSVTSRSSL